MLLCCCLLFSVLSLSASAADLNPADFTIEDAYFLLSNNYMVDIKDKVEVSSSGEFVQYIFPNSDNYFPDGTPSCRALELRLLDNINIRPDHEYHLSFDYKWRVNVSHHVSVRLEVRDSSGKYYSGKNMFIDDSSDYGLRKVDFNFKLSSSELPDGYTVKFLINAESMGHFTTYYETFYISNPVILDDIDDDSGWFQRILNAIKELPEKIVGAIKAIPEAIGKFFTDLWNNLKQQFENIGQWFSDLGDKIGQFFVDLYNDIIEGLKSLFVPRDGYFDEYISKIKDWASDRFGFLYTAGDLTLSIVTDLKDLLRDDYNFVIPAAKFTLEGQTYTLWDAYTVPMSEYINSNSFMKTAYGMYKTLLMAGLAFAVFSYAQRVFDKVISN